MESSNMKAQAAISTGEATQEGKERAADGRPMDNDKPSLEARVAVIAATSITSDINEAGPDRSPLESEKGPLIMEGDMPLEDHELPQRHRKNKHKKPKTQ